MIQKLPIAISYALRGWSVIPVKATKVPAIVWKDFQSRRATLEEITSWWTENPNYEIGIVTGAISNLTVIDIESDGDLDFVKESTYTVKTGGGGLHKYFRYEPEFKNAVRIFPSVDVRSEGGYVVAGGSESQKGPYVVLNEVEVMQMPSQLKETFLRAKNASKVASLPWYASSGQSAYPRSEPDALDYAGSGEGGRNDAMTKFAGTLHAKLHSSLWNTIGWQTFESANMKNSPPLPQYELRIIWNSISNIEQRNNPGGRDYLNGGSYQKEKQWGPAPEEPSKIILNPNPTFVDSAADDPVPIENDPRDTLHASEVAELQVIDSDHTYPIDMPVFDDALLGGFSAGEVIVVAGQSGHGKTSIIQDWSVTLAMGGEDKKRTALPILWFSYEVLAKPLWQKFIGMGATKDTPLYMPRFNETGDIKWVTEVIEMAILKWGIKVVAIDHLGFLKAPKGSYANAADAITHTVRVLKQLAVKHGLIILMPVHMRKTNSKNPTLEDIKDSSGIAQEADTVFFIGREKDESGLPTAQAKVWLVKNRKSGIAVSASFDFQFGRYYYNAIDSNKPVEKSENKKKSKGIDMSEWNLND